jgi:hypothetical protein
MRFSRVTTVSRSANPIDLMLQSPPQGMPPP